MMGYLWAWVTASTILLQCKQPLSKIDQEEIGPNLRLQKGNERFYTGKSIHPDISIKRIKELSKEQHPFAVVVSCSDSRAPDEIVFDQGLGDLFVIRTAGNVIADIGLGSIEYATEHLNVKYILVMGHEGCGAVKAFVDNFQPDNHIKSILDTLLNEDEINEIRKSMVADNYASSVVQANVMHQLRKIVHSTSATEEKVKKGELIVEGAVYDIENGRVRFIGEGRSYLH